MKSKLIFVLAVCIGLLTLSSTQLQAQVMACKCGPECKCKEGDKSQCKCGPMCMCHSGDSSMIGHGHSAGQNVFLKMMDTMMLKMDAAPLSASIERNFLVQMIPHHQGALDMARYEIDHGSNFEMIQLAKSILAEQKGEIMEMQVMLNNYPLSNSKVTQEYKVSMNKIMELMMKNTPSDSQLKGSVDCCFAMVMLPHHQAAIDMAVELLKLNPTGQVITYSRRIISDQQIEIEQMSTFINNNCKN